MKGRRRARSAALQALYEIDQSNHPLEFVLATRMPELFRAPIAPLLSAAKVRAALSLLGGPEGDFLQSMTPEALVGAGLSQAEAEAARLAATAMKGQAEYFLRIVRGVTRNREAIDAAIARIAPEWPVDQMAPIDRNVLRVALWEIATAACPIRVAINEAVELARAYSGESARRLVNGALGTFVSEGHRIEHMQTEEEWPSP